jgi:fluoride ion exporter CrcB/FEX
MANVYKSWLQLSLKVLTYDKIKHYYMPYDSHKYRGFDFFWRLSFIAGTIGALTTLVTYPFDLIHTRMTADLSKKGQKKLFYSTFNCFN